MNGTSGAGFPQRLAALAARAAEAARRTGMPVLVSVTEDIAATDPLAALDCALRAGDSDPALATLVGSARMFWSHAPSELAFAAIGAAVTIAPEGGDRFADADREWRALTATAITDRLDERDEEGGPLLLGGFAFDVDGTRSAAWRAFPATHLVVPALRVTASRAGHTLTACQLVRPDGDVGMSTDALLRLRDLVRGVRHVAAAEALAAHPAAPAMPATRATPLRPDERWRALVSRALAEIRDGRLRKVVLARAERVRETMGFDAIAALAHLRAAHPDAYVFGCWRERSVFLGATPERLARLEGRRLDASSLAGSAARGATAAEDRASAERLRHSAKDLAEHALVLAALRDALGRLADDVTADDAPSVLTLPNVHHLHTPVRATLRAGLSLLDVAAVLHPTPAVGGAPRDAALAFIRAHEALDRGWYAAPIGWIGRRGGELAVALRSALVTGGEALLYAGCGIVDASDPDAELRESRVKLRAMELALAVAAHAAAQPADIAGGASCR